MCFAMVMASRTAELTEVEGGLLDYIMIDPGSQYIQAADDVVSDGQVKLEKRS